jgi:topoisomerase-4 subunit A
VLTGPYKKCARVVGDVIGKYHPHGDQSVYDAMVRLAQDFSLRYPLVDGQGNFGNIDGDNAAAMRYTEARLTRGGGDLMDGLDEARVDFRPTYNGEDEEPEVFPGLPSPTCSPTARAASRSAWRRASRRTMSPNLSTPPRTADRRSPNADRRGELMQIVPGPDFRPAASWSMAAPCDLRSLCDRSRRLPRARALASRRMTSARHLDRVVTEIPYQVQKSQADRGDRRT